MKNVLFPRFSDDHLWLKVAIGVLLMFVPAVNIFAFGYLYRFLRTPRYATDGGVHLPEWDDWRRMFWDGLRLLAFVILYGFGSFLLSTAAEWLVVAGSFGLVRISWSTLMPLILVLLFPLLFVGIMQYQRSESFRELFSAQRGTLHYLRFLWWPMVWPALAFVGLQHVCGVLYGIAWFVGFGVAIASFNELLRHYGDRIEERSGGPA
ncbi:MAG: DUF4013 domain-containing protein [Puniceicoccales bacterium]|jgi:ABC-type multidrug transport system fused ATPase/permease subunit|nr:DUF4013 domain-containing protein [Puniceicoccales bacterium]